LAVFSSSQTTTPTMKMKQFLKNTYSEHCITNTFIYSFDSSLSRKHDKVDIHEISSIHSIESGV
jgi:hypothetical protein